MRFDNLKDRMEYLKNLVDYRLVPNSYVIAHVDGRSFSKKIKKRFERPFDDDFMKMMDETAKYLCREICGCKMAYVQSDEMSLILTDFDTLETSSFFEYRLCKLQSIIASLATCKFNQQYYKYEFAKINKIDEVLSDKNLFQFDCKCFNVFSYNDAFAWLKYRQNDCIRNSKGQTAQTYLPHKDLVGVKADDQIQLLKELKGIDWHSFDDSKEYGRIIHKELVEFKHNDVNVQDYVRSVWVSSPCQIMTHDYFDSLGIVPDISK